MSSDSSIKTTATASETKEEKHGENHKRKIDEVANTETQSSEKKPENVANTRNIDAGVFREEFKQLFEVIGKELGLWGYFDEMEKDPSQKQALLYLLVGAYCLETVLLDHEDRTRETNPLQEEVCWDLGLRYFQKGFEEAKRCIEAEKLAEKKTEVLEKVVQLFTLARSAAANWRQEYHDRQSGNLTATFLLSSICPIRIFDILSSAMTKSVDVFRSDHRIQFYLMPICTKSLPDEASWSFENLSKLSLEEMNKKNTAATQLIQRGDDKLTCDTLEYAILPVLDMLIQLKNLQ